MNYVRIYEDDDKEIKAEIKQPSDSLIDKEQFEIENNMLIKYHEKDGITDVIIPNGVISIGEYAFYNCYNIKKITIPNTVTKIYERAFQSCENLTDIILPNSLTFIDEYAFLHCDSLKKIIIPDSVTEIKQDAFCSCYGLESVNISKNLKTIENSTFSYCINLSEVNLSEGLIKIGECAFNGCYHLLNITIPNSVIEIGRYSFNNCKTLINVTIPKNVNIIGKGAFENCINIKTVNIYSYETFEMLDDDLKAVSLNTIIHNKQQFSEEENNKFKDYIINNKMNIFDIIIKRDLIDLLMYILINKIYLKEEIDILLLNAKKKNKDEFVNEFAISEMLLKYKSMDKELKNEDTMEDVLENLRIQKDMILGEYSKIIEKSNQKIMKK